MSETFRAWWIEDELKGVDVTESPVGPIHVYGWRQVHRLPHDGSAVVLPTIGTTIVVFDRTLARIGLGSYAVVPGGAELIGGAGLVIQTPAYRALSQIGGPVETSGRLAYIDGCSDSLLVCPPRIGEPCLNLLHLPPGINQTAHTHPSDRIGIILGGAGMCQSAGVHALRPGMCWYIPAGCVHSFHTADVALDVFAWHPDSDFGPSHDAHPMLNRTIVDGVPASDPRHAGIRTAPPA
jgi:quercetin dioxygenase-like cupin family protein